MVMFFAVPGSLDGFMQSSTGEAWREAFEVVSELDTSDLQGREPFGFTDGISQPELDWSMRRAPGREQTAYGNLVALGEFLLGYRNEYNKYTDRPVLDADGTNADLPAAQDAPEKKDLGRNGTYLVLRHLQQDVRGFWHYVEQEARKNALPSESLATAFVGRARNGDPLVPSTDTNTFTYDADPTGKLCPFGAHVRRSNPRNADSSPPPPLTPLARILSALGLRQGAFRDDLVSSTRFHRILRRGREYGPGLSPAQALAPAPPNDPERGLRFICLNANISRQFEFLQNAWLMNSTFNGMSGESDPLLGNRETPPGCPATADFSIPQENGMDRRISGLPQFVTVRGGAYFFLPGLRALRYLTGVDA
jgi:Dyp-type peroxidase family